jgi:hypothetical protein
MEGSGHRNDCVLNGVQSRTTVCSKIEEDEMDGTYTLAMQGEIRYENPKEWCHLEDLGVDGSIILKIIRQE